ncbi:hypothetical protein QM007_00565 [Rothia sp. SD9660Na]|nr:hypothetical protein [Rothia sp. SD9660Na]WHS50518.1 hypothetical protein QM007_00565 [Rothia sp. SD9660Na]
MSGEKIFWKKFEPVPNGGFWGKIASFFKDFGGSLSTKPLHQLAGRAKKF